ncbi:hypothetical protein ACEU6E_05855 [Halorutilales archaeon Cl-col2-1]
MVKVEVENPDLHAERKVDDRGRVYIGKDFSGKKVRVILESVEEVDEPEDE